VQKTLAKMKKMNERKNEEAMSAASYITSEDIKAASKMKDEAEPVITAKPKVSAEAEALEAVKDLD
jgi:hypothetical protein